MSKIIAATCVGGVVTADGVPVAVAEKLSQGVGASSGVLLMDGDKAWFIPKTSPDLDSTLTQIIAALDQVKTALEKAADGLTQTASMGGALAANDPVPATSAAAISAFLTAIGVDVTAITAANVQIVAAKTALTTLQGALK